MFKVYRNNLLLICLSIFVLSSLIHFFYYRHAPGIIISEDTYSYYLAGFQMYNKSIPVHYFRPPVYPFFLHGIMAVTGKPLEPMLTAPFYARLPYIIILQSIMISLSNCLLFITLRKIKVKSFPSLIFVLFISFNIIIFSWFRLLLTEAVAVFLLSLFFYLTVSILIKPTLLKFMFLLVLSLFCVFLRPIYILLPVVPTVIFVIYFQKLRIIFYCFFLFIS